MIQTNYLIIGSGVAGLNYKKKGLIRLIKLICSEQVDRIVLTHKDRLLRFGSELIFTLCEHFGVEVILINRSEDSTFEEDLAKDVMDIEQEILNFKKIIIFKNGL